jgi:hypothetical protein
VIGPGGSGKTRLATETARTLLGDLPDGAWLVELVAIGADGDVAQATLATLRLRDALLGGRSKPPSAGHPGQHNPDRPYAPGSESWNAYLDRATRTLKQMAPR